MDRLSLMFKQQNLLQLRLGVWEKINSKTDLQSYINQNLLACFEEVTEIMRKTGYKNPDYTQFGWKKNQHWDVEKYKEEIIDLFHFLMNLSLAVGMDADEFYEYYCNKNQINHDRQDNDY